MSSTDRSTDQREIKSLMVVRLYAVEREVFCSLAPASDFESQEA